ncbi:hypothetical protein ACFS7Z_24865 [Pontibacter toksunensis]|uniref:Uncharacterized protein n=1 Tax=Pontibacter toksunensis TaxID=1332631 RepID=A0ABW6C340_9BACT
MPEHISNPPRNFLSGQGQKLVSEQTKDTKISEFLKAVPLISSSDIGLFNTVERFGINIEELKQRVADHEAKEGQRNG